jgi:heat shock protein HslJ/uncharacterized lipoprotein NlpE involved in copper resistance
MINKILSISILAFAVNTNAMDLEGALEKHLPNMIFPASYEGVLPCADCTGIETRINLWEDGVYHMHETYLGTPEGDQSFYSLGRWHADPIVKSKIYLHGSKEAPAVFTILQDGSLEKQTIHGKPIASPLSNSLTPFVFTPININTSMTGEFRYMADAALFTECHTQRTYPVAMQSEYLALEKAYSDADKSEAGAPIVVSIEGEIKLHPGMDASQGDIETVFVNRFIGIPDGLKCERALSHASLVNTYWKLKTLDGEEITPVKEGRQAHIILQDSGETKTVVATAGCNRMRGSYQINGDLIEFESNAMAMTLMACPPPLDQLEKSLSDTLSKTKRWRIESQLLEFFDAESNSIALLEAVYLP